MKDEDPPEFEGSLNESLTVSPDELTSGSRFDARDEDFSGANDEALAIRLSMLEEEHRDLDAAILALEANAPYERLTIARLKKKKLSLKDKIKRVREQLLPDIIA